MNATNPNTPNPAQLHDDIDLLGTMQITKIERRTTAGGAWVVGTIGDHLFNALVFSEHAESESYELGQSRISKFWLRNQATRATAANFDRGWDIEPTTDLARRITDLLAAGLAETVFGT